MASLSCQFSDTVNAISDSIVDEKAEILSGFLSSLCCDDLVHAVRDVYCEDPISSLRKVVTNPPSVFELATYNGFCLELLFWYPLHSGCFDPSYDTEDVHDHFGWIVSRMISGPGYVEQRFNCKDGHVSLDREVPLRSGCVNVIKTADVHSIYYPHLEPSISVRVVFPPERLTMTIYNRENGFIKESIECSTERKAIELVAMLRGLSGEAFCDEIRILESSLLSDKSLRSLDAIATPRFINCELDDGER